MKIGIDARFWSQTGVGRYTKNLLIQLSKIDSKNEYVLFANSKDIPDIHASLVNDKWSIVKCNIKWHSLSEQFLFPKILNSYSLDLVHFPYFSHPIFYNKPFVVTIHDLIINHFPTGKASTLPLSVYVIKLLAYQKVLNHAVRKSKKIIVPLNFVKTDLSRTLKVPEGKIEVTTEGFDPSIRRGKVSREVMGATKSPYFLYVGNAYPHKNLEKLIEGFYKAKLQGINLVFVGKDDFFYKRLEKNKFPNLIFLHNVSDSDLYHLYSNSIAAVSASLMEGFGLLPLEAFGAGTMPVVSNIPAFSEVCGDSAIYFNPHEPLIIAEKLKEAFKLPIRKREERVRKGDLLLKKFSWKKMAKETLHVYESSISLR